MGVKDLWTLLTPYAERKPIYELRGKAVAIDLAGWVCGSLNVVDYFIHPRHYLKNLFFRTCYLIWEDVTPIFVLEGIVPKLKSQVIAKRSEKQFRGVKSKDKCSNKGSQWDQLNLANSSNRNTKENCRTRFDHVLKQCEVLLNSMGIQCLQGPGEAEAYCAFLNKKGLVDGVISQDSDCFAYGALRVYRNFSVSSQGSSAAQGGSVDIYDMTKICQIMDFGQNKIIVMALLCGCDYCPEGVGGIGRDSVLKLFSRYNNEEILERIKSWRKNDATYTSFEMKVDDKSVCTTCGHMGRIQSHTKSGCAICRTSHGCNENLWKEERLSLKAEIGLRKKALADPVFPAKEIIDEFLTEPKTIPNVDLCWKQPNIVKFIKQVGHLLQWSEIYCFQKFFPILTRWQVVNSNQIISNSLAYVVPKEIRKKRTIKGVVSLEVLWKDEKGYFKGLIPDEQLMKFDSENAKGVQELWTTVEPMNLLENAYPNEVTVFLTNKNKNKNTLKRKPKVKGKESKLCSFDDLSEILAVTNAIAKTTKQKKPVRQHKMKKGLQKIDKFLELELKNIDEKTMSPKFKNAALIACSTPVTKCIPSDLESDIDEDNFNMSKIITSIIKNPAPAITKHAGKILHYESVKLELNRSLDDMDLVTKMQKRNLSSSFWCEKPSKKISLDDSFDVLVNHQNFASVFPLTHVDRFKNQNRMSLISSPEKNNKTDLPLTNQSVTELPSDNVSYFFENQYNSDDEFQKSMNEFSCLKQHRPNADIIVLSDSTDDENKFSFLMQPRCDADMIV